METRKEAGVVVALAIALAVPAWLSTAGTGGRIVYLESLELRSGNRLLRVGEGVGKQRFRSRMIGVDVTGGTPARATAVVHSRQDDDAGPPDAAAWVELLDGDPGIPDGDLRHAFMGATPAAHSPGVAIFMLSTYGNCVGSGWITYRADAEFLVQGRDNRMGWQWWPGQLFVERGRRKVLIDWSGVTRPGPGAER